jgi:hypothetical protein
MSSWPYHYIELATYDIFVVANNDIVIANSYIVMADAVKSELVEVLLACYYRAGQSVYCIGHISISNWFKTIYSY